MWATFSCNDTIVAIKSDCYDIVALSWAKRANKMGVRLSRGIVAHNEVKSSCQT